MVEDTVVYRLKERRTSLGFTQRQLAEGTEMNVRTIINIEKGKTIPNLLYAMKLAKFLGVGVEEVFECKSTEQMSDEGYNSNGE